MPDQAYEGLSVEAVPRRGWTPRPDLATRDLRQRSRRPVRALRFGRGAIERGWCQGEDMRRAPDGTLQVCVAVAPMDSSVRWTLAQVVDPSREPYGDRWEECEDATAVLIRWNDAPERTKDEVLALFDAAIWATENDREPGWPPQPGTETRDV